MPNISLNNLMTSQVQLPRMASMTLTKGYLRIALIVCLLSYTLILSACKNELPDKAFKVSGVSTSGLFSVELTLLGNEANGDKLQPIVGHYQQWNIRLTDIAGQPLYPATINVSGGMPNHGHGLPTQPQIARYEGDGYYLMEGLKLNMTGAWVLRFSVLSEQGSDSVELSFDVEH